MKLKTQLKCLCISLACLAALATPATAEDFGILNQYEPEQGVVFGGQPTAEQLEALAAAGFKSIIDLRGVEEDRGFDEADALDNSGMAYLPLPITGDTMQHDETFDRFLEIFEDAEKPVLVHCASGNRVGALYYAYLVGAKDTPRQEALETAKANGLRAMSLLDPVNRWLDQR